ncbi:MAG: hypothetical protein JKX97_02600 [Candidatus Lindowbacteria bacterium]|nr:hypothetical protein [Candidatus Lindowbacteria bacterium]
MLFYAHSGLRYLVLLACVIGLGYAIYGLVTKKDYDKKAFIMNIVYISLLDLQVLLGILLIFMINFHSQLIGHIVMMLLAIGSAHAFSSKNKKAQEPGFKFMALGFGISLICIIGGIMAIGRSII